MATNKERQIERDKVIVDVSGKLDKVLELLEHLLRKENED